MEHNLAVYFGAERVAAWCEIVSNPFEIVELTVHDYMQCAVFIRERLITGTKVDDTQPSVPQYDLPSGRLPNVRSIGSPVM